MTTENIVFVEYNGKNNPFQVWTDDNQMFDFSIKNGFFHAEWAGYGKPYMHKLNEDVNPRKVWFKEDFRPMNPYINEDRHLQNREIVEFGFSIIETPTHLEEIVSAIKNR